MTPGGPAGTCCDCSNASRAACVLTVCPSSSRWWTFLPSAVDRNLPTANSLPRLSFLRSPGASPNRSQDLPQPRGHRVEALRLGGGSEAEGEPVAEHDAEDLPHRHSRERERHLGERARAQAALELALRQHRGPLVDLL